MWGGTGAGGNDARKTPGAGVPRELCISAYRSVCDRSVTPADHRLEHQRDDTGTRRRDRRLPVRLPHSRSHRAGDARNGTRTVSGAGHLAEWAYNTRAATDEDAAFWIVGGIGRAAVPRTASASYTLRIERDAVISAFRFSDMPGTNIIGQVLTGSQMPVNRINLDVALIFTKALEVPADSPNRTLTRLQVDARFSF